MSLKLSDFYENYENKYVFKNGAKLTKIWEGHLILYLKIEHRDKIHYFYVVQFNCKYKNKRMKLKKFRYSKNFKKIELCDWTPSKNFENYLSKIYLEFKNKKNHIDSFFDIPWHEYE
jgi:hypothetical protein